jgi:hypothetical protein
MGVAAYNRGSAVITRQIDGDLAEALTSETASRVAEQIAAVEEWTRDAMAVIADPKGLLSAAIATAKTLKGWAAREQRLVRAHCAWVDSNVQNMVAHMPIAMERARAAWALLNWARRPWKCAVLTEAPPGVAEKVGG